ncbi:MAG: hypothetical protein F6J86_31970 [Symploca sp. SIO1B1]|nr:hypothetical protein [Symploca sp. SIO1B1]
MTDLFTRLARRTLGLMPLVQPRIVSRFAPEEAMASENANVEIPSLFESDRSLALRRNEETRRHGEAETRGHGDTETRGGEISSYNQERAIASLEQVSPGEVELRKENLSAADIVTHREIPVSYNGEVTELGNNESRYSPTQQVSTQAAGEGEGESSDIQEEERQIASETEFPTESYPSHNQERTIASLEEVTLPEVESRQENLSAADRVTQTQESEEAQTHRREISSHNPGKAIAFGEIVSPGEVELRAENLSAADRVTPPQGNGEAQTHRREISSHNPGKALASLEQVSPGEVELRKENLSAADRVTPPQGNGEAQTHRRDISSHNPGKAIAFGEIVSPGEVELRAENLSVADQVTPRETLVPHNVEATQLGDNEHRHSPTPEALTQTARGMEQKARSQERETRVNESEKSANPEQASVQTSPTTVTANIFSTNQKQARESATVAPITEEKVDLSKVNSLEVDRGIASERPLKSRSRQEQDSKVSAEQLSTPNTNIARSIQAVALQSQGKVQSEHQLTAPEFSHQASGSNLPIQEPEKPKSLTEIGEIENFSSRREELSKVVPETVNKLTEVGFKKGDSVTQNTVNLAGVELTKEQISESLIRPGNDALQLYESKLAAEERKASRASTPTIQVTIGKIEVRGTKPAVKPVEQSPRKPSTISNPRLSLDEYLKQRNGGKR